MENNMNFDNLIDEMIDCQADAIKDEQRKETEKKAKNIFKGFVDYIKSKNFDEKCEAIRKKYGYSDIAVVKNATLGNVLKKINKALNISIAVVGDLVKIITGFLLGIINFVVNIATGILHKLINLLTMKKEEQ